MEPLEVIDLSSDDEKSPPKKRDIAISNARKKEEAKDAEKSDGPEEVEIVYNVTKNQKRHAIDTENENRSKMKKLKLSEEKDRVKVVSNLLNEKKEITIHKVRRIKPETLSPQCTAKPSESDKSNKNNDHSSLSTKTNGNDINSTNNVARSKESPKSNNSQTNAHSFKINEGASSSKQFAKPQLTIKDKIEVSDSLNTSLAASAEMMESFLDVCRKQDPGEAIETIICKLKKKYKNLEPSYAKSGQFMQLMRKKKDLILNDHTKLYLHMSEVSDEMKARPVRNRYSVKGSSKHEATESGASAQSRLSDIAEEKMDDDAPIVEDPRNSERLRALEKAMKKCERFINKCETAEVNFDDEYDSHYILGEKYKFRMLGLYNKYCEITGERPDAARPYLRPKNLSVTPLPSLNHAITSFINMKITKMNKSLYKTMKKNAGQLPFTDALVFPDYIDILSCVEKCNTEQNLQLSKSSVESMAKNAFSDLGAHLQRCRQSDYYDTFSLYLEKGGSDPAVTDKTLAEKLNRNQEIGKKNLDQVFQDFAERQDAVKVVSENGSCLEKEEDAETGDESSADSDDQHSETSESEECETNDQHPQVRGDSNHERNDDVVSIQPQHDLNQTNNHNYESDKVQDDFNQKDGKDVELDELPENLNEKSDTDDEPDKPSDDSKQTCDKDVEVGELQGDLNENCDMIHDLDTDVDSNEKTTVLEESSAGPDPISVQTIDDKNMEFDTSEPGENRIVDNVEIEKKKGKEILLAEGVPIQTENNKNPIDQIKINEITNNTADPSDLQALAVKIIRTIKKDNQNLNDQIKIDEKTNNTADLEETPKIAPLPSQILNPTSTVTRCEVNLMPTANTPQINVIDRCSPAISANDAKVIDAPAVATADKPIDEKEGKKPVLRLRQFAKPPGSWNDSESPTKNSGKNTKSDGTADAKTETIKIHETLPGEGEASNFIKSPNQFPIVKAVQLKNGILMNLNDKKSTVIIPANMKNSSPKISVKNVTNHLTFNFNSQDQLQPKVELAASPSLVKPAKRFVRINNSGRIVTGCNKTGVITIGAERGKIPDNSNLSRTAETYGRKILPNTMKPATQIRLEGQQTIGNTTHQVYKIVPSKSAVSPKGKIVVRHIPFIGDHGKKIFRIVDRSPGAKEQNIIVSKTTAVVQNPKPNSNSSAVAHPKLKQKVSNSVRQTVPFKVTHQTHTKFDKGRKSSTNSVPIIQIE